MRSHVLYSALGLVLVAGSSAVSAQTLIAPDNYAQPAGAVVVPQQPAATAIVLQRCRPRKPCAPSDMCRQSQRIAKL